MKVLLTRRRLSRLAGFASAQVGVQVLGFLCGIVLIRHMGQAQYGYYTLAITLVGVANVLTELGVSNAVLAIGGRLGGHPGQLRGLLADAQALHAGLAAVALCLVLPAFALLLVHQQASLAQALALTAIGGACAFLNVRNILALSVARLAGHLGFQQRVDLGMNGLRLVALMAVAAVSLDATIASALNLGIAAATFLAWRRYLARAFAGAVAEPGAHRTTLRVDVRRQAPNCIWYVFNSQLAVWLVALFGTADRVADVGALGRLGAGFAVIVAVIGGVIQPYFARHHASSDLDPAFVAVNGFFAALTALLGAAAMMAPAPMLWILGAKYAGLQAELVWMMLATSLAAWSGALYTIGCGRGWVLPGGLGIGAGVLATVAGLALFDVSTVAGNFKLNTLTAGVAVAVNLAYVATRLARHRAEGAAPAGVR